MKTCSKCKKSKPISDFYKNKARKSGISGWCKVCDNGRDKKKYTDKYKADGRRKPQYRRYNLMSKYGLKPEDIPSFCQICRSNKKIHVDHDHETKRVRGFLCDNCNKALGFAKDRPEILDKLAKYIRLRRLL